MSRAGKRVGDVRPPVAECVQLWDRSWMEAQVRSAYRIKKHRLMKNRGVVLSYEENKSLARRSMWVSLAPVVGVALLLVLAYLAMSNHWLSGGEKGVIGRALEGESVEGSPDSRDAGGADSSSKGEVRSPLAGPGGLDPLAVDLTTPNDGGPVGIPEAGVPGD